MWINYLLLSIASLIGIAVLSFVANGMSVHKKKNFSLFNSLFASVFISAFLMFMPIHIVTGNSSVVGIIRAVFLSLFNSIQIFALGSEFTVITDSISYCPENISIIYQIWAGIIFILAPVFTFSFVLSMFKNLSAHLKYYRCYFKDVYVFSELNEKSIALATDIKNKEKKSVLVFTDVFEGNEERIYELTESAKMLGAICFKKDLLAVKLMKHSAAKHISVFAIGENETENLNQALRFIEEYRDRPNTNLYVFSTKIESELLLTAVDKGNIRVRRINEINSLINRILYENGEKIFESATVNDDGTKDISAVVVGMGGHGAEMVKSLAWFGQMDGYRIEINAFDKDNLAEEKFTAQAPELMSPDYNGVIVEGESQYTIKVHPRYDVESALFAKKIMELKKTSYVFVSLGNDDINVRTAVNLRMLFERIGIHPVIQTIVFNTQQKNSLCGIKNYRGQEYDIEFIGDLETSFSEKVIIDSELEADALKRHLKWGTEDEFWAYEYNYRSSVASAIHMKARIKCGIPGATKREDELTDEERDIIEVLEHRRWNAYMRSVGYVYSGSKDKASRNDLAKMHHNLVDFESLSESDKRKDSKVGSQ